MSEEMMQTSPFECPAWFDGKKINETVFCEEFLRDYPMVTVNDAFFTVNGRVHDENRLKKVIYDRIKYYVTSGVAKKVTNLLDVMRMECCTAKLSLYQDRIHVANGTYYLNGTFSPEKDFCRNRLPVAYNPDAPQPVTWLHFLSQLLEPEDILTLQEFMGYCFIPSTKGQQSYQGDLYVRFIGLGNGVLQSLYDRSVGFFRRQIILSTKEKDPNRKDDPYIAEKMCAEAEGIFLWALEGLHRLIDNDYKFTVSQSAQDNMDAAVSDGNNIIEFLSSEGYIRFKADYEVSSKDLYAVYKLWCDDNALSSLSQKSFCSFLKQNESRYNIEYTNKVNIGGGRYARGFVGIELLQRPFL